MTSSKSTEQLEILERLSTSNTCSEQDDQIVQSILRSLGFPQAIIITGIVYIEGKGHPISIHLVAQMILKMLNKETNSK